MFGFRILDNHQMEIKHLGLGEGAGGYLGRICGEFIKFRLAKFEYRFNVFGGIWGTEFP